jgi:hypothetical protein
MLLPGMSALAAEANNSVVPTELSNASNEHILSPGFYNNILEISEQDKMEIQRFLKERENVHETLRNERGAGYVCTAAAPAVVAVYFIPGIGEVALLATGAIVVGGITYYAGSWMYNKIMPYIIGFHIPKRLMKNGNTVDLSKFNKKIRGKQAYKEDGGWYIEKDTAGHGGSKWKLKKPNGERVASLDEKGKILRK